MDPALPLWYVFFKGGELLYLGGPAFSLDSDGSLLINSPSGNESGEFICTATNAAGYASRKVQLTVYGKRHHQLNVNDNVCSEHLKVPYYEKKITDVSS